MKRFSVPQLSGQHSGHGLWTNGIYFLFLCAVGPAVPEDVVLESLSSDGCSWLEGSFFTVIREPGAEPSLKRATFCSKDLHDRSTIL